jgi:hypothetical protein
MCGAIAAGLLRLPSGAPTLARYYAEKAAASIADDPDSAWLAMREDGQT